MTGLGAEYQTMSAEFTELAGAPELCAWFGGIPTFADGPVLGLSIVTGGFASFTVRTWPLDDDGRFRYAEPADVTFHFERVSYVELADLQHPSTVDTLTVRRSEKGFLMEVEAVSGLVGSIESETLRVEFKLTQASEL